MADNTGSNDQGNGQGGNSQSSGNQTGSAGQGNDQNNQQNQNTGDFVPLSEFNKVKKALSEVLQKKDKYKGSVEQLERQIEELKQREAANAVDPKEQAKKYEEIIANQSSKINGLTQQIRNREIYSKVKDVSTRLNAHNPEAVLRFVQGDIMFDEAGNPFINDGKGEPAINKETGKVLTIEEHVSNVLENNKYFLKPSGNTGSDSSGNRAGNAGGRTFTREQIAKMSTKEYDENKDAIAKSFGMTTS